MICVRRGVVGGLGEGVGDVCYDGEALRLRFAVLRRIASSFFGTSAFSRSSVASMPGVGQVVGVNSWSSQSTP